MATVSIIGVEALKQELSKFPEAVQARAVQTGVRKAASKLRTAMRQAAYGKLLTKGRKRTNRLRYGIRTAIGKQPAYKGKAWVAHKKVPGESRTRFYYKVLEVGRKAYSRRKGGGGKYAASPPMRPFWAKTWAANRAGAQAIIIQETLRAITYEAGKAYGRSRGKA